MNKVMESEKKGKKKVISFVPYQWTEMHNMEAKILELAKHEPIDCVLLLVEYIVGLVLCPHALNTCPRWVFKYMIELTGLDSFN